MLSYFSELGKDLQEEIFYKRPEIITADYVNQHPQVDANVLGYTVGSLLYTPSTRGFIFEDLVKKKIKSLHNNVFDFEDAIDPAKFNTALATIYKVFNKISQAAKDQPFLTAVLPNIWIRISCPLMLMDMKDMLREYGKYITGIILPKAESATVVETFHLFELLESSFEVRYAHRWYLMPIIESAKFMRLESRMAHLLDLRKVLRKYKDRILQVRVGATDFCGLFGVRRAPSSTIYDISVVRDALSDILNVFAYDNEFAVSGPVWEYFAKTTRLFKPTLRPSLVSDRDFGEEFYNYMIDTGLHSFIQEIQMDIENGFVGKTVIHPTQVVPVQAMLTVSQEEYTDAVAVQEGEAGVSGSDYQNKMNEHKPHQNWSKKILARAASYGVLRDGKSPLDIIYAYWAMSNKSQGSGNGTSL